MTATEHRYFVVWDHILDLGKSGLRSFAQACYLASSHSDTRGQVYELSDDGTVRLVAQMATVS